jgi:hypothetical protein
MDIKKKLLNNILKLQQTYLRRSEKQVKKGAVLLRRIKVSQKREAISLQKLFTEKRACKKIILK